MSTKKSIKFFVAVFALVFFAACSGGAKTPKSIATDFLNSLSAGDFNKAKEMVTADAKESIESLEMLAADKVKGKKYTVKEEKVEGEEATVTYTEEGVEGEKSLKLKKVEGNWQVMFDKNEFTGTNDSLDKALEGMEEGIDSLQSEMDTKSHAVEEAAHH